MANFLDYYKKKATIYEMTTKHNTEETLQTIIDMMEFEDEFFSYVKKEEYTSYLNRVEECISNIDTLLENYEKLEKLDVSDNNELVDKIKNGITSMTNEIKSIKDEMIKKRLISIRAEVEVIVANI